MNRVLTVHNYYQQPGGEDAVVEAEKRLLLGAGHRVVAYTRHNGEITSYGLWQKVTLAPRTVWAWDTYREFKALLERERPEVAHFHNTFPLISPAAYFACREAGVPVVQTLHNYRLLCPGATLMRQGEVCDDCLAKALPWQGVVRACYRSSRIQSATLCAMLCVHKALRTGREKVDVFVALTEFARQKFIEGGLPAGKIVVKPNFVDPDPWDFNRYDPGARWKSGRDSYALFVGRLSAEKGLRTLLAAWRRLRIPLRVAGAGPLRRELESSLNGAGSVRLEGRLRKEQVLEALKGARFLVFPSEWYEGLPLTITEAFACGVPVIASRLGAMAEIVEDGKTGLHFTSGDTEDLAAKVEWAWAHPVEMQEMGLMARAEYEAKYTAKRNYELLMAIYGGAMRPSQERKRSC